jgi:hypothetical protein
MGADLPPSNFFHGFVRRSGRYRDDEVRVLADAVRTSQLARSAARSFRNLADLGGVRLMADVYAGRTHRR